LVNSKKKSILIRKFIMARSSVLIKNLPEKLNTIKKQLGLSSDADLASLLQVRQSTITRWRCHKKVSFTSENAIADLEEIVRRLKQLYPTSEIRSWLARKNPLLRDETPIQALRGGRGEVVRHIVHLEEEGIGV
jgi:hypothetical protein